MVGRKAEPKERNPALHFNPSFKFDFAADDQPQAAWEFAGALKQARENFAGATTIDEKIQKRLKEKRAKKQPKVNPGQRKKGTVDHSSNDLDDVSDDSDDGNDSDDSENQPLPGELDDDSDDNAGGLVDDDEDEEAEDNSQEEDGENTDEEKLADDAAIEEDEDGSGSGESDEEDEADSDDDDFIDDGPMPIKGRKAAGTANGGMQGHQKQNGGTADVPKAGNKGRVTEEGGADGSSHEEDERHDDAGKEEEVDDEEGDVELGSEEGGSSEEEADVDGEEEEKEEEEAAPARKRQKGQNGDAIAPDKQAKKGKQGFYADQQGRASSSISFEELRLSRPLLKAIAALGYKEPTPIQAACIPLALSGRDICGSAVTGSGKTAAYALPILERLLFRSRRVQVTYVVILAPTRELAVQVHSMIEKLAQFTDVSAALAVGGLSLQAQAAVLKKNPEILVATPGRLIDHVRNTQSVGLEDLAVLVLDEADRLLEMGFKDEIHEIIKLAPKKRQTMLFSATFSAEVSNLVSLSLKQPVRLAVDPSFMAPEKLWQEIIRLKGAQAAMKEATLLALCSRNFHNGRTIIFTRTKQRAHRLKILFGLLNLPPAGELHGDMTQAARLESLEKFRLGQLSFLLATDVAARGLDIVGVETVINFDAPRTLETHMHRIGRTARAGAAGRAITLAEDADRKLLKEVVHKTKTDMHARLVAPQAVSLWQNKIEGTAQDVSRIYQEEREEREMRKAEMQVTKAQNMLDHEDEIMARPARTWFQSQKEKLELVKRARLAEQENDDENGGRGTKQQASKQKDKAARKADRKAAKAAEEAATKKRNRNKLKTETEEHSKKIKSIKSKTRELVQQGVPVSKATKIASASVTGISRTKKKKKSKDPASRPASNGLFQGDERAGGEGEAAKARMSTRDRNRLKRSGKSKNAFKSKKKFKRRK